MAEGDRIVPGRQAELERNIATWKKRLRQVRTDSEKRYYREKIQEARDEIDRIEGRVPESDKRQARELLRQAQSKRDLAANAPTDRRAQLIKEAEALERRAAKLNPMVLNQQDQTLVRRFGPEESGKTGGTTGGVGAGAAPMIDPIALQRGLKALGYYGGAIDGIIGDQTRAAIRAWEAAGSPAFPSDAPADVGGTFTVGGDAGGGGGGGGGGTTTAPPTTTPTVDRSNWSDAQIEQEIRDSYPGFVAFLDIPEIRNNVIFPAIREGWPPEKMRARMEATDWWRKTAPTTRAWMETWARDPAAAIRQIEIRQAQIFDQAAKAGIYLNPQAVYDISENALRFGWTDEEVWKAVSTHFKYEADNLFGQAADTQRELRNHANEYMVTLSDATLEKWVTDLTAKRVTAEDFDRFVREHAKSMFPYLANAIDKGITIRQYADPYLEMAARELGLNPAEMDLMDPKWMAPLVRMKDGQPQPMNLAEWAVEIKRNPTYKWGETPNGRAAGARVAWQIVNDFGRIAS